MLKLKLLLLLSMLLSTTAQGGVHENAFIKLKSALQLGQPPADSDQLIDYIFFIEHNYDLPKTEMCRFLSLSKVKPRADAAVDKFTPRKVSWFANFRRKVEPCRTPGASHFNTWLRKMDFNILLFGTKAKDNYLREMRLHPILALDYQLQYARVFLAEGQGEKFEREINNILNKKIKPTELNVNKMHWARVFLANYQLNLGNFEAADNNLKMIPEDYLAKDSALQKEYQIIAFQKAVVEKLSGKQNAAVTFPAFCDFKSDSFMRYRELEICLIADVMLNKNTKSPYLTELEPLISKLFPIQVPQLALTLIALEDQGLTSKVDARKLLADIELPNEEQTIFKYIFEYAKNRVPKKDATSLNRVIKAMGRYSLFGIIKLQTQKEQSGG